MLLTARVGRLTEAEILSQQTAARQAHQREAEMQEAREHKRVQDLADQQLAKATAAYSAEIAAVAGPEEAGQPSIFCFSSCTNDITFQLLCLRSCTR